MLLYVYLDHTKAKFKSYLRSIIEKISVELSIYKISVNPRVTIFQGYMNSHLVHSYISACKTLAVKQKVKQNTNKKNKEMFCLVY